MRQFQSSPLAQSDKIDRLAPRRRLLSTSRCRHLADNTRQHGGRMLPTDEIETLEGLVDEVERVSSIGIGAVCLGRQQKVGEVSRRSAASNGG